MRLYIRVAWSVLGLPASALVPSSARAPAHLVVRIARATRFGVAAVLRAFCVIGFSIPFFICTSTRVSCGFDLVANIRSTLRLEECLIRTTSVFRDSTERQQQTYILTSISARSTAACTEKRIWRSSSVSALTVCICTSNEDAHNRPIKFNDGVCILAANR